MHVLMLSKALVVGAYQRKAEELAKLPDLRLTVVVPPSWRDTRGEVKATRAYIQGYDLLISPIRFNGNFHLHYYPQLPALLRALKPDIVHLDEEPWNLCTWHGLRAAHAVGAKTCFFAWQNIYRCYPPPFHWFEQAVFRGVEYGIVGNQAAVEVMRRKGYQGPLAVIPQFGVDPELFSPANPLSNEVFSIGYAGGLLEEKGIDLLLKAAARLPQPWRIRLAGEGAERENLGHLADNLGIADQVAFAGRVASTAMPDFYRSLSVLVQPSRTRPNWKEQFGRSLVEAMACGVPVVASDSGEMLHVVGEAGLIFPEDDVNALYAQLLRLQAEPQLRDSLATAGRAHVLAHYTQAHVAQQTYEVYRRIKNNE